MADELTRRERRNGQLHAVHDGVETALENADQVFAVVAAAAHGFFVVLAELLLGDIAVVALQLLFRHELHAVIGRLLAALAVLARAVLTLVERAFGAAPQVHLEAAVDLELRLSTFGHWRSII